MRFYWPWLLLLIMCLTVCGSVPALADEAVTLPDAQILVNQANPLPSYLEPESLVAVSGFARGSANVRLREDAAEALKAMLAALKEDGIRDIYVNSGYRSFVRQGELYTAKVASYRKQGNDEEAARSLAARWVLPAGDSEHQTGLAVDLSTSTIRYELNHKFADTAAGLWLTEHCTEYGFIVRYTEEKEPITGVAPEPWHFRYVGIDHAVYMREHELCLEEYHALLKEQKTLLFVNSAGLSRAVYYRMVYRADEVSTGLPGTILSVSLAHKNSGEYIVCTAPPPEPLFDVVGHWSEQQIRRLYELGAVSGYEDGSFRPGELVSRGEFITMLSRLPLPAFAEPAPVMDTVDVENPEGEIPEAGEEEEAVTEEQEPLPLPYPDIDETKYYYQPLLQCFRAALVQPMLMRDPAPQLFQPEKALLRREAALLLEAVLADEAYNPPATPTYSDVPPETAALFRAVEHLTARGVIKGDLGLFNPEHTVSRAEISAMLSRLLDALEQEQAPAAADTQAAADAEPAEAETGPADGE